MDMVVDVHGIAKRARQAARSLRMASTAQKNESLLEIAGKIWEDREAVLAANRADLDAGKAAGLTPALLDRLLLDEDRLRGILNDLRNVVEMTDPVGERFEENTLPNGLAVYKQRVPLGVLGVIYEARPNVTVDITSLALKTGNAAVLRGGKETIRTNSALINSIHKGLAGSGLPEDSIMFIDNPDRSLVLDLLRQHLFIDMLIPRGSAALHQFCRENSQIPVITGGIGICHLFVDESAEIEASLPVIRNAKVQRPSVCNALDTLLVHKTRAAEVLPRVVELLSKDGVVFKAEPEAMAHLRGYPSEIVQPAGEGDFDQEWLSLVLGLKVVENLEEAVEHIEDHSTGHSDGILTQNQQNAQAFVGLVDSAAVYVNASTRFTDGSQLGLGAEVAVSTQRLHARGPMGLRELTTYKWVIAGNYHFRR